MEGPASSGRLNPQPAPPLTLPPGLTTDTHKPAKMAGLMLSVLITKNNKDRQTDRKERGREGRRKEGNRKL